MISAVEITDALRQAGVQPGDVLFVHAGLQSALRVAGDGREAKMGTVLDALDAAVPDGVLMLPTFTYSFCRGEDFDVARSPSTVGMLTESFRGRPDVRRTPEPIFSVAVRGRLPGAWEERLFRVGDVDCFGEDSVFAYLREADAKLLFFGVGFEFCTFMYLVEQRSHVSYRYFKDFSGDVVDGPRRERVTASYYVRRLDEDVENAFLPLAGELLARGLAVETRLPRGPRLLYAPARAVHDVAVEQLARDPEYLLTRGHREPLAS
jgi:aminoglycoside 3-N-acetyltransferase